MISFSRLGLLGQLGNQLFQVAATLAAARRFGTEAKFPYWNYASSFQGSFNQTLVASDIVATYYEERAAFSHIPNIANVDLFGFFQSQTYFIDQEKLIRESFTFSDHLLPSEWIGQEADCSIHIRRGDYAARSHEFVPLKMDYYSQAIDLMKQNGCKSFLVFTDEIDWYKRNFDLGFPVVEGLSDIQSLALMSKCRNHVIANSTFSWWGSWLCQNDAKLVIAPQIWYGFCYSFRKDENYQYCANWQLVPNEISPGTQLISLLRSKHKRKFLLARTDRKRWMQLEYEDNVKKRRAEQPRILNGSQ